MPDFNALAEFRQRYPQAKLTDQEVYRGLANPDNFRAAFPEFSHLDNTVIGRNVAAEAGTVSAGKPWYKQAAEDIGAVGTQIKENIMTGGKSGQMATLNRNKQIAADAAARKAEGRSLPYRMAAGAAENSGLFSPRPMEEAANAGHPGEVVGHGVAAATPYIAPLAIEGVIGAGKAVRSAAMEEPAIARQRAMNVAPKSKQAIRAQKEGTAAAPYLKGAKNLADVQAKIPAAKQEIFQPYMDAVAAHDATGQMLTAPDGSQVTAAQLEDLRQETSAQLKDLRKAQPTEQQAILQKNQSMKALNDKYRAITTELDPVIRNQGIDPKKTRATFGAVKGVEKRFEGRSTLLENKPSGLRKAAQLDLTKPLKDVGQVAAGAQDIVAGRGWFNQKPTDVQVREGFRTAGPKPNLTVQPQPPARGLPPGPVVTPPPAATPPNLTPPAVAPTSRAQRLGLILPENVPARPELSVGHVEPAAPGTVNYGEQPPAVPVTATEPPSGPTANRRIVRDPATGKMKIQYLTSSGGEIVREAPPAKPVEPKISTDSMGVKWAETPDGVRVSIPKGIREENVVQYAQNKLKQQAEGQKSIKSYSTTAEPKQLDTVEAYQSRVEKNLKSAGITPENINMRKARGTLVKEETAKVPAPRSTGIPLVDVQREVNAHGMSDVVTPTEARKLSAEFAKPEYQNMTPLMKRKFIQSHLTYGGR